MIGLRRNLKALSLCVFTLGLMMFSASGAQAETGAQWRVNGADVGSLAPQLEIKEIENKSGSLSFVTKGGTAVLVLCTSMKFDEGGKLIANGGISLGRVLFAGCSTLLNEVAAPKCRPHSPDKPETSGEILTLKFTGLIVLDKVEAQSFDLVKFTPDETKAFAHILFGETCAIGEEILVEGEMWVRDGGGNAGFLTEAVTHLAFEALNKLIAFGQPAKLVGSAVVGLSGVHQNLTWSGRPA